jgi:hypothetical protein
MDTYLVITYLLKGIEHLVRSGGKDNPFGAREPAVRFRRPKTQSVCRHRPGIIRSRIKRPSLRLGSRMVLNLSQSRGLYIGSVPDVRLKLSLPTAEWFSCGLW